MLRQNKTKTSKKKLLIVGGAVAAALLLGGGIFWLANRNDSTISDGNDDPTATTLDNQGETISLDPPSESDKQETEQHKQDLGNQAQNPPVGSNAVTPVITSASVNGVYAYVPGIFEEGGTCTANFSSGNQKFSRASQGFQNVQNTGCAPINLSRSDFPSAGTWNVTVTYTSPKATGTSQNQAFEVK